MQHAGTTHAHINELTKERRWWWWWPTSSHINSILEISDGLEIVCKAWWRSATNCVWVNHTLIELFPRDSNFHELGEFMLRLGYETMWPGNSLWKIFAEALQLWHWEPVSSSEVALYDDVVIWRGTFVISQQPLASLTHRHTWQHNELKCSNITLLHCVVLIPKTHIIFNVSKLVGAEIFS